MVHIAGMAPEGPWTIIDGYASEEIEMSRLHSARHDSQQ